MARDGLVRQTDKLSINSFWFPRGVFFIEVDLILWLFMMINLNEDFEVILTKRVKGDVSFGWAGKH